MSDGADAPAAPDLASLVADWVTLWQSELAALALDREAQESWQRALALWAAAAGALLAPGGGHERAGDAGAAAAPGAAPAAAASDPRDAEIARLHRRIGELDRRLAALERDR